MIKISNPKTDKCFTERGIDPAGKTVLCPNKPKVNVNGRDFCQTCFQELQASQERISIISLREVASRCNFNEEEESEQVDLLIADLVFNKGYVAHS